MLLRFFFTSSVLTSIACITAIPLSSTAKQFPERQDPPQINQLSSPQDREQVSMRLASQSEWDELQRAALLSSAAYANCQLAVEDVTITHQINEVSTDTVGFIGYSTKRKRISVVMRGSKTAKNFLNDVDIALVPLSKLPGCSAPEDVQIMKGVYRSWASVHQQTIAQVTSLTKQFPDYAIELTGHSLGGALSTLSFVAFAQILPDKQLIGNALNSFPIGNAAFANFTTGLTSQNRVLRRGTNGGDGVPNMYSAPPLGPLYHVGQEYHTKGTQSTTVICNGQEDPNCAAGNGHFIPNLQHYLAFGVSMKVQGAVACIMSGGFVGPEGSFFKLA